MSIVQQKLRFEQIKKSNALLYALLLIKIV